MPPDILGGERCQLLIERRLSQRGGRRQLLHRLAGSGGHTCYIHRANSCSHIGRGSHDALLCQPSMPSLPVVTDSPPTPALLTAMSSLPKVYGGSDYRLNSFRAPYVHASECSNAVYCPLQPGPAKPTA